MRAGRLRDTVTIETSTVSSTASEYNEPRATWTKLATVRAEIKQADAGETTEAGQVNPEGTVEITIRYLSGVNSKSRIKFGSRYLYPQSVIYDPHRRVTVLTCREQL